MDRVREPVKINRASSSTSAHNEGEQEEGEQVRLVYTGFRNISLLGLISILNSVKVNLRGLLQIPDSAGQGAPGSLVGLAPLSRRNSVSTI